MAKLGTTTVKLIFEGYKGDLKGLFRLFTLFAGEGLSHIAQAVKFDIHDIIKHIRETNPEVAEPLSKVVDA
jgi:hypothetical protein